MKRLRWSRVAFASILVVLAAGCAGPTAVTPAKSGALASPAAPSWTPVPSCLDLRIVTDSVAPTVRNLAGIAPDVFAATFQSLGSGHWNTRDGTMPADPTSLGAAIYTDATFGLASALRGAGTTQVILRLAGGAVGCSREEVTSSPVLVPGTRYLVWVGDAYDTAQTGTSTPWVMAAWPIDRGDRVATPEDGTLALSDIAALVRAYPLGSNGQCAGGKCP